MEYSREEINFLDVTVKLNNKQFVTNLYCKPTDSDQYLHYNSYHLEHMKKSSVYSQGLQIKRLFSDATSLINHLKDLRSWFCNRGYPESMVKEQLKRVENRIRNELLCTNSCIGKDVEVPLLLIIHTLLVWHHHLQADQTVKSVFAPAPFVSFHTVHNLQSHLVRSKLYSLQHTTGSWECNTPRCQVDKNVKECYEFSSHVTKKAPLF